MKKWQLFFLMTVFVLGFVHEGYAQTHLEGDYKVKGWNAGVSTMMPPSYTGRATIKKIGNTYRLNWQVGAAVQAFGGVGLYDPKTNILSVSFGDLKAGGVFGIVLYKVKGDTLEGEWATYRTQNNGIGIEILEKQ
ncbi:MAG: hypothetical protein HYU97_01000 [Deltaproteobacteria bacterium]|nr:hypothetical protein [Deltaproteobacteria bacterium]